MANNTVKNNDKQTTNDNIIKDTQYTSGKVTENFINEANIKDTEPLNQSSSRNINNYRGISLFRYDYLFSNDKSTSNTSSEIENIKKVIK